MKKIDFNDNYDEIREKEAQLMLETALRWCAYADSVGSSRREFRKMAINILKRAFDHVFKEMEDTEIVLAIEENDE